MIIFTTSHKDKIPTSFHQVGSQHNLLYKEHDIRKKNPEWEGTMEGKITI